MVGAVDADFNLVVWFPVDPGIVIRDGRFVSYANHFMGSPEEITPSPENSNGHNFWPFCPWLG